MADKLVALLGSGKGPRLFTGRMQNLHVKVANHSGDPVYAECDGEIHCFRGNGEFPIPATEFIQFDHQGKNKQLICIIQSKAHALQSAGPDNSDGDRQHTGSTAG